MPTSNPNSLNLFDLSSANQHLVSIITVVLNEARHLEEAMQSVFGQTYPNIEYIIIDGGSTDGSLDIIHKYKDKIDCCVSEPDLGVYDAMNKGLALIKGDIIGFVNADDALFPDTVEQIVGFYRKNPQLGFTYGSVQLVDRDGRLIGCSDSFDDCEIKDRSRTEMPFAHPSCFVARKVYQEIGYFDLSFRLAADYDFIIRMMDAGFIGKKVDKVVAKFRIGGVSSSLDSIFETWRVHKKHGLGLVKRSNILVFSVVKYLMWRLLPKSLLILLKKTRKQSRHSFY